MTFDGTGGCTTPKSCTPTAIALQLSQTNSQTATIKISNLHANKNICSFLDATEAELAKHNITVQKTAKYQNLYGYKCLGKPMEGAIIVPTIVLGEKNNYSLTLTSNGKKYAVTFSTLSPVSVSEKNGAFTITDANTLSSLTISPSKEKSLTEYLFPYAIKNPNFSNIYEVTANTNNYKTLLTKYVTSPKSGKACSSVGFGIAKYCGTQTAHLNGAVLDITCSDMTSRTYCQAIMRSIQVTKQ
jgi:hypothetical protein